MRILTLVAAITIMHTAYALPASGPNLAVRRGVNDLSNDKHIFHHLDRNQRTANRVHVDNGEGPGLHVAKRLSDLPRRAKPSRVGRKDERLMERRFMQGPDYSQGGSGSGPNGVDSASNTTPTPQPQVNAEKPGGIANRQGRSLM